MDYEQYMKIAIKEALSGEKEGEPPFGGIMIDKDGSIIARSHDTVLKEHDMTCHSELNLVKIASSKVGADLSGCTVICTCEPCPLCFTALWLSKVSTVVFGSTVSDVLEIASDIQRELNISTEFMNEKSGRQIKIVKNILRNECIQLWENHKELLQK
jgi:tRNA(Arg) A34 adenosine deaminase TadA